MSIGTPTLASYRNSKYWVVEFIGANIKTIYANLNKGAWYTTKKLLNRLSHRGCLGSFINFCYSLKLMAELLRIQ